MEPVDEEVRRNQPTTVAWRQLCSMPGFSGGGPVHRWDRWLAQAVSPTRESLRGVRRLVWSLRPETLEQGDLSQVLQRLTAELSQQTGIAARTLVTGRPISLPTEAEVTLLRVAQEALANVRRHARARQATLTLCYAADGVTLGVRDDGTGFDLSSSHRQGCTAGWACA